MAAAPVASLRAVHVVYGAGDRAVCALRGVTLDLHAGCFVSIMGPSGSGKSTLLSVLGGLAQLAEGSVTVAGRDLSALSDRERAHLRSATVAYVFQSFGLLPTLTARQNVAVPLRLDGISRS